MRSSSGSGRIERVSPNDATVLATDRGPAPMNIAAVLLIEDGGQLSVDEVRDVLGRRVPLVHRLRQRLLHAPPGCGRPVWVDAADFRLSRHLAFVELPEGTGLLEIAADQVCSRLSRADPMWSARWVTGLPGGHAGLVIVLHHCLSDGLGGLAALAALCDPPAVTAAPAGAPDLPEPFPAPLPTRSALAREAWRSRALALTRTPRVLRGTAQGLRELTGSSRPGHAAATSLNRPTGPLRRLGAVSVDLDPLVRTAHQRGCTVNDLLLCAVSGALGEVLHDRGELLSELVASVPVSQRPSATADRLGNQTGVLPLALPLSPDRDERLRRITALTSAARGPGRGASAGPLGLAFRTLAALGVFQLFIDHQRLVHTFVSNVRGPSTPLSFAGHRVSSITPVAVTPGNVGVSVEALSYSGRLVVTVVADPALLPDPEAVAARVGAELAALS